MQDTSAHMVAKTSAIGIQLDERVLKERVGRIKRVVGRQPPTFDGLRGYCTVRMVNCLRDKMPGADYGSSPGNLWSVRSQIED
jgi:hypothetical protein